MRDKIKVCGTCVHVRLSLGIATSLDFKVNLTTILSRLIEQCDTMESLNLDDDLFEVLALLNWLSKQKFYCRKEKGWTHLFDTSCYSWQSRKA